MDIEIDGLTGAISEALKQYGDDVTASQNEFYSAGANGITVSAVFMVNAEEYTGQTEILFNAVEYHVERTFQKDKGNIGLVCSTKAG